MASEQGSNKAIWISYAAFLGMGLQAGLLGLAWTPISQEMMQPLEAVGVLLFAGTAGYLTSSFVSGALAHRVGYAKLFMTGALLFFVGMVAYGLAPTWPLLALAAMITGLGSGSIDGGLNAYSAVHFSARAMNWMHACFGIGMTFAPLMLTVLLTFASWRVGYLTVASFLAIVLALFVWSRKVWGWPAEQVAEPGEPAHRRGAIDALKSPLVWVSILVFVLYAGVEVTPGQWTFSLFTETRGINPTAAGFWVSFYWASFTIGRILFGFVGNRWPVKVVLRSTMVGLIIGALLYWLDPFNGVGGIIGLGVMGFSQAPMFPFLVLNTPLVMGKARASHSIGFQVAGAGLGVAIIPSLAGLMAAQVGLAVIAPFVFVVSLFLFGVYELLNTLAASRSRGLVAQSAD
ncbi:MAG: MFS transporter [Anaerolineae bacterium]